jgi:type IV secretory pathway TrbF-like protein
MAMLTASGAANLWQGQQSKTQVVHVVHDTIGTVITVHPEGAGQFKPSPAQLAAGLRSWVTNVRTVGVDVNAMRRAIPAAFNLVASGTQAWTLLTQFFQGNDPFKRATLETVNVSDVVAIPPPPSTLGKDDLQTWRVQWVETVVGRDGIVRSATNQVLTVTFTVTIPKSLDEATSDPDGIHVISFSWTRA